MPAEISFSASRGKRIITISAIPMLYLELQTSPTVRPRLTAIIFVERHHQLQPLYLRTLMLTVSVTVFIDSSVTLTYRSADTRSQE